MLEPYPILNSLVLEQTVGQAMAHDTVSIGVITHTLWARSSPRTASRSRRTSRTISSGPFAMSPPPAARER